MATDTLSRIKGFSDMYTINALHSRKLWPKTNCDARTSGFIINLPPLPAVDFLLAL